MQEHFKGYEETTHRIESKLNPQGVRGVWSESTPNCAHTNIECQWGGLIRASFLTAYHYKTDDTQLPENPIFANPKNKWRNLCFFPAQEENS